MADAADAPSRKRLRAKTPPPAPSQRVLVALDGLDQDEADQDHKRQVYLVTFAHPRSQGLTAPGSKSKRQMLQLFLESCAEPIFSDSRSHSEGRSVALKYVAVFREYHAADSEGAANPHDHIAVMAMRQFRYLPVKRALRERYGLASHWSGSHDGYWSPIRYLSWPSPKKPDASLDARPVLWAAPPLEHPRLEDCRNEPLTAAALRSRREKKDRAAAEAGVAAGRITEMDVWGVVVQNGFRNTDDNMNAAMQLGTWAKAHGSDTMRHWLFKNRTKLNNLIDDIWKWEHLETHLAAASRSRIDALHDAAKGPCACRGVWCEHVLESFRLNDINAEELCGDILAALKNGRGESTPVLVLAGIRGGEGKSLFLKALRTVFGSDHVFSSPQAGGFALLDLPGKKVVFLDEWRFDNAIVPYAVQDQWYDGSSVTIPRPQNVQGQIGHFDYKGSAPIFATSTLADLQYLETMAANYPRTGLPRNTEASMMFRRLKIYRYWHKINKPPPKTPYCGHCFAQLILNRGVLGSRAGVSPAGVPEV